MKMLITIAEMEALKSKELVPLECAGCGTTFYRNKTETKRGLKGIRNVSYCSTKCAYAHYPYERTRKEHSFVCELCKKQFVRVYAPADYERQKHRKKFCSHLCACRFNRIDIRGMGRSKLEKWVEAELQKLYPALEILYNDREAIKSELDIYIPALKLAFELNGPFHYEMIFGEQYLNKVQTNDRRKFQACIEKGIELCVIATNTMKYFSAKKAPVFLKIIADIISQKMERVVRVEQTPASW